MKKVLYLLVAAALLLAFVPAVAVAHTEDDPFTVPLLAGQTEDIGDVFVWNDADYLYVKFLYTGPDCGFLEVHLQVDEGTWSEDILTKKGNPIPGQFEMSYGDGCFKDHTFTYDLAAEGFSLGDTLLIAAHAATGIEESMWVASDGDESFMAYTGPGTATYPCEVGALRTGMAAMAWQHSAWASVTSQFNYGTWIWEAYRAVDPVCGTVVDFEESFDIPGDISSGTLWVTADNGYEAYLNGTLLVTDGLSGDWRTSDLTESYVTTAQASWSSIEIATWLMLTGNKLRFQTANEYFNTDDGHSSAGTIDSNPGGLIYEAEITYYADGETAWGEGTPFNDKNWATYFTYTVQGEIPEEWPEVGTHSVAYEDLPLAGGSDWDYNDLVVDIDTLATFWGTSTDRDLVEMEFNIRQEAKLAGYHHMMYIGPDTDMKAPACAGTYDLTRNGVLVVDDGTYDPLAGIDVVVINDSAANVGNNIAQLTITFDPGCAWSFPVWDQNLYHGENLFYDPYLFVYDNQEEIHTGDVRMLTVPTDWIWPSEGQPIWDVYPKVGVATDPYQGPVFEPDWWTP